MGANETANETANERADETAVTSAVSSALSFASSCVVLFAFLAYCPGGANPPDGACCSCVGVRTRGGRPYE